MNGTFGKYLVAGLAIGALFGFGIGAARGNSLLGVGVGALVGVFVGWFAAAAAQERAGRSNMEKK